MKLHLSDQPDESGAYTIDSITDVGDQNSRGLQLIAFKAAGSEVALSMFPGKVFVVQPSGKLAPREPYKPGDRMVYLGTEYVLQADSKTWSRVSGRS